MLHLGFMAPSGCIELCRELRRLPTFMTDVACVHWIFLKTVAHRFWNCRIARGNYDYGIGIIKKSMKAKPPQKGSWRPLDWQHEIFEERTPSSLRKYATVWLLFIDFTLWTI